MLLLKTNHEVFTHYLITFSKMNPIKILKKLRFGMRRNILSILILLAAQISITQPFKAAEINCKSPVHKNNPKCKGGTGKPKREITILDPETGLMVIEMDSDINWSSTVNPKIPYNNIVKLKSSFDQSVEYVVFDRDYKLLIPNEYTVLTKWSTDYVQGAFFIRTNCGIFGCIIDNVVDSGDLSSPLELKFKNENYTLYGDDGQFILPNEFVNQIKDTQDFKGLSLRIKNRVIPIGEETVEKLSILYKKSIKKWEVPNFKILVKNVEEDASIKDIASNSLPKVVTIKSSRGQGTGFFINDDGLLMTNRHVIGSGKKVNLQIETATGAILSGDVIYVSRKDDFAIIKVNGNNYPKALPICYASYPVPGEEVIALGSPRGLSNTITRGIVSAFRRSGSFSEGFATTGASLIQTDAAINPGNSGGPLINSNGEVIGINTFAKTSSGGSQGLNFAVSIIDILQQVNISRPEINSEKGIKLNECGNIVGSINTKNYFQSIWEKFKWK